MTETMTQQEALKEAQRRWGSGTVRFAPNKRKRCMVGRLSITRNRFVLLGSGTDWSAAFADAEKEEKNRGQAIKN